MALSIGTTLPKKFLTASFKRVILDFSLLTISPVVSSIVGAEANTKYRKAVRFDNLMRLLRGLVGSRRALGCSEVRDAALRKREEER